MITGIYLISKKVKTKNIASSIEKIAKDSNVSALKLHFEIHSVDTFLKTVFHDEYIMYNEDINNYYSDPHRIIDEHMTLKQTYIITIKDERISPVILKYEIDFSSNNIFPAIIIHPESKIPYKAYQPKEIYALLIREFNNIKAYHKIIINLFDEEMREKLKLFVKYLYEGKFTKKIKLPLFKGIEPEKGVSGRLVSHYLGKKDEKLQYIEVEEGELLVEYIKPIFGKKGFNAFGDATDSDIHKNSKDLECRVDTQTIDIIETDDKKEYRSKVKGFIHIDKNSFYIDNRIHLQKLSRVQDKVVKDEANNIEVIISQNDTNLDSIGEGVNLISETIHISGHIGAKSTIKAVNLTIDGATHQESYQEAKFAKINRHKGKLRCHNAKIHLLEGGEVYATNVEINDVLNGVVYAENVTIGRVKNNLKVYASSSITIKTVLGENNIFKISYKDVPTLLSKYRYLERDLEDLRYKLDGAKKHTPANIPVITNQINELKNKMLKITQSSLEAKISVEETFHGVNTIIFTLSNGEELVYKTTEKQYEPFHLKEGSEYITLHPTTKKIAIK